MSEDANARDGTLGPRLIAVQMPSSLWMSVYFMIKHRWVSRMGLKYVGASASHRIGSFSLNL
eukprot:2755419-Pleurochrysis_carterae.AAC.1